MTVPSPSPKRDEALVRVRAAGFCGSDLPRIFEFGTYRFPCTLGHEFAGEVCELPKPGQTNLRQGSRVAVYPLIWCGHCPYCQHGEYPLCDNYDYLGSRRDGGFAEYVSVPVRNLVPIPDEVSFEQAAMTEPAAVSIHGLLQARVQPGERVAVVGGGCIGLMTACLLKTMGCRDVYLIDVDQTRLDLGSRLGFRYLLNPNRTNVSALIRRWSDGLGADLAVESAGTKEALALALGVPRKGGRVLLLGQMHTEIRIVEQIYNQVVRRQLQLFGSWNSTIAKLPLNEWEAVLGMIAQGYLDLSPLITHRYPFREALQAVEMMRSRKEFYLKVMLDSD